MAGVAALTLGMVPVITGAPAAVAATGLQGGGSIDEAWMTGADPGDAVTLLQNGVPVSNPANPGTADALGSLIIRNLTPGSNYQWDDTTSNDTSGPFTVLAPAARSASDPLYSSQPMHQGLNYITMRDGIQLAATVRYPQGVTCSSSAPCPTVIEYSGYGVAGPTDPIPFLLQQVLGGPCTGCGDPNLLPDSSTEIGGVVARFSGFATVSLEMRGMGCSGGAFDLFGYPSDYDAYDAIETVAHQSWVSNHKVGMVGISFSGLSEFPAAGTQPPDLAAIAPLSPTDDLFSTGYPGGIFNNGFAQSWINGRIDDAKAAASWSNGVVQLSSTPVSGVGQPWTYYQIDNELAANAGESTCLDNQALHGQSQDLSSLVGAQQVDPNTGAGRDPALFDRRSMSKWAQHVTVPVFVSGAAQDEQTGPQWPALLNALPKTTPVFGNLVNGGHIDSADPQVMSRWLEFLDIYVAQKVPAAPPGLGGIVLDLFASFASGTSAQAPLPAIRFTTAKSVTVAAKKFAKQTRRMTVFFDNGAGSAGAGDPQSTYSTGFTAWPPKGKVTSYFFGPTGTLSTKAATAAGGAPLVLDPSVRAATSLPSGNPWAANPGWVWDTVPAANGVAFDSPAFTKTTTVVGPATVALYVKSPASVVDLQVTITEVRPSSSQEEYVTSGFLRSSNQVDNADSTSLFTDPTYLAANARSLSSSAYSLVKVPVAPIAHTFRAGTKLRIVISAPGGDRPSWMFATLDNGQQATIGYGGVTPSALVVNQVGGVHPTATLPTCGTLRGEPCRAYQAEGNQ